eukprot:gene11232-21418_t
MEEGKLELLNDLISVESDVYIRKVDFADFENDIDLINQHANDEDVCEIETAQTNNNESELDANDCAGNIDKIEEKPQNVSLTVAIHGKDIASTPPKEAPTDVEGQPEKQTDFRKRVVFNLPDIPEYSDDFDSDIDEVNIEEETLHINTPSTQDCEKEKNCHCSKELGVIQNCNKCDCRLTSLKMVDFPELNSLFSKMKTERKLKNENKKACSKPIKRKKSGKREKELLDNPFVQPENAKTEGFLQRSKGKVGQKRTQVQNFWDDSSDRSLLQWLKQKNKETRKKKIEERKLKKEEKREQKIKEIDKICRKEIASKKFDEWIKTKKQEKRKVRLASRGKVSPTNYIGSKHTVLYPEGYTILETFSGSKNNDPGNRKKIEEKDGDSKKENWVQNNNSKKNRINPSISQQQKSYKSCILISNATSAKTFDLQSTKNEKPHQANVLNEQQKCKTSKKKRSQDIANSVLIKERPDPQGCDDPGNAKISSQEECADVHRKKGTIEKNNDLLGFLSGQKRPWMDGADRTNKGLVQSK